jgi:hypothetical protein
MNAVTAARPMETALGGPYGAMPGKADRQRLARAYPSKSSRDHPQANRRIDLGRVGESIPDSAGSPTRRRPHVGIATTGS